MSYRKGHMRNGRKAEKSWTTPPADYLAEEEARIQVIEREWEQRNAQATEQPALKLSELRTCEHPVVTATGEDFMKFVCMDCDTRFFSRPASSK